MIEDCQGPLTYNTQTKQRPNTANFYGKTK